VTFIGDAMAAVVQGVEEVRALIGQPPVVVGGLAVMCRLSNPYRATTDLDMVDRLLGEVPQLQVLRAARGAEPVEPSSVLLPTVYGQVKVDVLEVRQIEIDQPSDDPGDRLHAFAHAWANDSATEVTIEVAPLSGAHIEVSALVAEPGPLVAMKLQAIMNRAAAKQGTDLQDVARLKRGARQRMHPSGTARSRGNRGRGGCRGTGAGTHIVLTSRGNSLVTCGF
jgi:hypothetical protein